MSTTRHKDDWEEVDPRIKEELERLNNASHRINVLEKDHEEAQEIFRLTLAKSASSLKSLHNKLGKKVDQARPYYETLNQTQHVHNESEQAAARYERACDNYGAAKHMVKKAEEKLNQEDRLLDSACQEMLNHATMKVMNANQERIDAERVHLQVSQAFTEMQDKANRLRKNLKSVIHKTRPYFELKEKYNKTLEGHKRKVFKLQKDILNAKQEYHTALRNLESISDSIHEQRSTKMSLLQPRGQGVGAEAPDETYLIESVEPDELSLSAQVEMEMESAMRSITVEDPVTVEREENGASGEENELSQVVSRDLGEKKEENTSSTETPTLLRKVPMKSKLFISPLTPEQSGGEHENSSVQLEKWFFFSSPDHGEPNTEKQLSDEPVTLETKNC